MVEWPLVRVRRDVVEAIIAHARAAMPNECCGLLLAASDVVTRAWPARNLAEGPTRYLIDPTDHFAALRAARAEGQQVVGAYHSHPVGGLEPSNTDRHDAHPHFLYLIASPTEARPSVWILEDGEFRVRELVIEGDDSGVPGPLGRDELC